MDELEREMKLSFIDEARQLLEDSEQCFLDLESRKGDPMIIEQLFRLAHNMKGTSRAVGFGGVAEFTHQLENLLLKIKERQLTVENETVDLLLACNDHLKMMIEALSRDLDAKFDSSALLARIELALKGQLPKRVVAAAPVVEAAAPVTEPVLDVPPASAFETEADPFTSIDSADTGSSWHIPSLAVMPEPVQHPEIESALEAVPQVVPAVASAAEPAQEAPRAGESERNDDRGDEGGGKGGPKKPSQAQAGPEETIRVSLSRLENLSDFIGELVILQTVLNQHRMEVPSQLLQRTIAQLGKISKEIQGISMSLRMIPLKQTFSKLQRIVRDTSKALDKQVELQIVGEQTEVDKTVLEHLSDPLVHIIRNAVDHGLESTEKRRQVGKPAEGRIRLEAFHQGNNLVIEIQDDGGGIDPQKLVKKALEKGLIPEGSQMTDQEAINLIFLPGYSTKEQVSEISGRGVGLDVVKTNVERLGGEIQLESVLGEGSTFRILLPLTLAIIDGMVVLLGDERYVVPVAQVHETVQPVKEDVHFITGKGEVLVVRDEPIPLLRLNNLLTVNGRKAPPKEAWNSIAIIVKNRHSYFAVLVDDIIRQQQIVIKKLGVEIRNQKGLTGSAILGDGKPALILDLNDLTDQASSRPSSQRMGVVVKGAA